MSAATVIAAKETKEERRARRRRGQFRPLARDCEMVSWVYEADCATREQLTRLFFSAGARSRCQTRLTLLYRNRYLDRIEGRLPNQPDVYVVSRRSINGLRLLRARGQDAVPRPLAPARLSHQLAVNACRIQFLLACRGHGFELLRWLDEEELRSLMPSHHILPDGYCLIGRLTEQGERRSGFFLEVERSDKSDRLLQEKFRAYGRFYYGGEYERLFGSRALRVLVLVGESYGIRPERRVAKFAEIAARANVTFLRFAPLRVFTDETPAELLGAAIWHRPDQGALSSLF
jgi:hypothetical protein